MVFDHAVQLKGMNTISPWFSPDQETAMLSLSFPSTFKDLNLIDFFFFFFKALLYFPNKLLFMMPLNLHFMV